MKDWLRGGLKGGIVGLVLAGVIFIINILGIEKGRSIIYKLTAAINGFFGYFIVFSPVLFILMLAGDAIAMPEPTITYYLVLFSYYFIACFLIGAISTIKKSSLIKGVIIGIMLPVLMIISLFIFMGSEGGFSYLFSTIISLVAYSLITFIIFIPILIIIFASIFHFIDKIKSKKQISPA